MALISCTINVLLFNISIDSRISNPLNIVSPNNVHNNQNQEFQYYQLEMLYSFLIFFADGSKKSSNIN